MLQLRPNCECCDRDLPPDSAEARICSFECTFCAECVETRLNGMCPNCGGELAPRPIRPAAALERFPAQAERVTKCATRYIPDSLSGYIPDGFFGSSVIVLVRGGRLAPKRTISPVI
ncbi:MAG: DUF1272 domain-containing protein, partial [Caulobacteraceae bacterium]|nr:DUF1272 domain-containing protein [Caulobacteraceae bacterium]